MPRRQPMTARAGAPNITLSCRTFSSGKTLKISQGGFVRQMLERLELPETVNSRMSPLQGGTHLRKNEGRVVPLEEFDMQ